MRKKFLIKIKTDNQDVIAKFRRSFDECVEEIVFIPSDVEIKIEGESCPDSPIRCIHTDYDICYCGCPKCNKECSNIREKYQKIIGECLNHSPQSDTEERNSLNNVPSKDKTADTIYVSPEATQDVREFLKEEIEEGINKYKKLVKDAIVGHRKCTVDKKDCFDVIIEKLGLTEGEA